jgi:hypothetical protein
MTTDEASARLSAMLVHARQASPGRHIAFAFSPADVEALDVARKALEDKALRDYERDLEIYM